MAGKKANMVLTDPPYNVDVEETAGKIKNDNMPDDKFYQFLFAASSIWNRTWSRMLPSMYSTQIPRG